MAGMVDQRLMAYNWVASLIPGHGAGLFCASCSGQFLPPIYPGGIDKADIGGAILVTWEADNSRVGEPTV